MELKYGLISVDDHVQEHPEVWTRRMSKAKWGNRIPQVERHARPRAGAAALGRSAPHRL